MGQDWDKSLGLGRGRLNMRVALLFCACISTSSSMKSIFSLFGSLFIMLLVPMWTIILLYLEMSILLRSILDLSLLVVQPW